MSENERDFFKIRPAQSRPPRLMALILYFIAAAGLFIAQLPDAYILGSCPPQVGQLLCNLVYYVPFIALPSAILLRRHGEIAEAYRPNPLPLMQVLMVSMLALTSVYFVNDLDVLWAIPWEKLGFDLSATGVASPVNRSELLMSILAIGVLPAVCEETLFRGTLLSALEPGGTRRAIRLTALLFAGLHGSLIGLPGQIVLGAMLAFLVVTTDSIYAGIIFHTVYNSATLILEYLQRGGAAAPGTPLIEQVGGMVGVGAMVFEMLLMLALGTMMLRLFGLQARLRGFEPLSKEQIPLCRREIAVLVMALAAIAALYALNIVIGFAGSGVSA